MARGTSGLALLRGVFESGTLAGLSEAELLARYLSRGDERAFEALVSRHAPMVLGVCRRHLQDPYDVEDAFQATFLVFVRRAASIREPDRLSSWLYGVARRVSLRARELASERRKGEGSRLSIEPEDRFTTTDDPDVFRIFDEEMTRLPDRYRSPIVLCLLEGRTHDEAAAALHWPLGTVRSRLFRGRELLKSRLDRRGVAPSSVVFGKVADALGSGCHVSTSLIQRTVQNAVRMASNKTIPAAAATGTVAALTEGVLSTMWFSKFKLVVIILVTAGTLGSGAGLFVRHHLAIAEVARRNDQAGSAERASKTQNPAPTDRAADSDAPKPGNAKRPAPSEMQVRLRIAIKNAEKVAKLYRQNTVGASSVESAQAEVEILQAQIEAERENLQDELERLEVQLLARRAELHGAEARLRLKQATFDRMKTLQDRGGNAVAREELDKGRYEMEYEVAQCSIKQAEVRETEVRLGQLRRRLKRLEPSESTSRGADQPAKDGPPDREK
jgi:RNA polymerase sigma factor (sigma-70 family)